MSPVYDYIYRSEDLDSMSLYEWARSSERMNLKQAISQKKKKDCKADIQQSVTMPLGLSTPIVTFVNDDNTNSDQDLNSVNQNNESIVQLRQSCYRLHPTHPLYDTHVTYIKKTTEYDVVNFIGGTLPRPDQGDYGYYCSTMLALFKPWRTGKDLKLTNNSWDTAFENHNFTPNELQLMKNFNLRYECLDARDDYRAQLKAGAAVDSSWNPNFKSWLEDNNTEEEFVFQGED
ncbi:hypothetical protein F5879DRAFT_812227, partial [Lentinula edodes]